jgi:hypothetical protein
MRALTAAETKGVGVKLILKKNEAGKPLSPSERSALAKRRTPPAFKRLGLHSQRPPAAT